MKCKWNDCVDCYLGVCRERTVEPRGRFAKKIMFVGEAPGADEEQQGLAFVGASGRLLNYWLTTLDLSENDVYITNVVKCRPPGNRDPTKDEIASCLRWLTGEIDELQPRLIIPLGRFAKEVVSQLRDSKKIPESMYGVALKHPAYYLRTGGTPSAELAYLKKRIRG